MEIALLDKARIWRAILIILVVIGIFIGGYLIGAKAVCKASGGTLFGGKVCVDLNTIDYCYFEEQKTILRDNGVLREPTQDSVDLTELVNNGN